MKKIIVIGASGMLGKPVTKELIKAGFEVTLGVRDLKKARQIFPFSHLVQLDVLDTESLENGLKGQNYIYISLNTPRSCKPSDRLPEKEGISNIIKAASKSSIQRIAFLSSLVMQFNGMNGYRWWLFSMKKSAVDQVKKSGIPYTIFYPSSFMETLDQTMLRGNALMLAGKSKAPMWFIAGEDFGRQVASSFQKLTDENREYPIQGPEAFTFGQAAKVFIDNYPNKKLRVINAPMPVLEFFGTINRHAHYGFKIMQALNNYPETFESQQTWEELGKPTITLQQYAQRLNQKLIGG